MSRRSGRPPERAVTAVQTLNNAVLPFYARLDLPVGAILTENGRGFCGTETPPYELDLALNDIEHRRTKVKSPKTNGVIECFNGTVLNEFFRLKMRDVFYESVAALQADLDAWLVHYNTERPISDTETKAEGLSRPSTRSLAKKLKTKDKRKEKKAASPEPETAAA